MLKKNNLGAVTAALLVGAAGAISFSSTVFAQGNEMDVIEEVFVTGSRIKRSDVTSAAPVTVLSSEDLMKAGTPTIENFLQDLPVISGGDFGSTVNNGNPGWATASIRGLGPIRTLVLVNGRRPASAGAQGFVDLNMIPTSVIERIEVLRDGASTIYGSDAIAGVINIITKKDFDGMALDIQYDITDEQDGAAYLASLTFGRTFDRGSILLNGQYTRRDDIWQRDRGFSDCPLDEQDGMIVCGGSPTAYPASIGGVPGTTGGALSVIDPTTGQPRLFDTARDAYNFAQDSYMVTPQEVYSFFGSADYRIIENSSFSTLNTSFELNFANRVSDQLLAPVGTFWAPTVGADHPDNPFGTDVTVLRRLAETGGRSFNQDATSWSAALGFDGEFGNGWSWNSSFKYSRYVDTRIIFGQINQPRVETLLSSTACSNDAECPGVWNPFARNTLTQEMQDYALVTHSPVLKSRLLQSQFNLTGDFGGLELPGGKPAWAVGVEHRAESASDTPDGAASLGQIYFVAANGFDGGYSVDEFYAELSFPILRGAFLTEELTIDVSGRYTDYSFLEEENTYKYGINWAVTEDVRFRYTFAEGLRAPNLSERLDPERLTAASYTDPCINATNPTVIANCRSEGLDENFNPASSQATGILGGNVNLDPETSESQNIGIVVTPRILPNFTATIDYFIIDIEDAIGTVGTNEIIGRCYDSPNFSSPLCAFILGPGPTDAAPHPTSPRREVGGTIAGQVLRNENLATFETKGVDFDFVYDIESNFGSIELKAFGTWLDSYKYIAFEGAEVVQLSGKFGTDPYQSDNSAAFPEWKTNLRVSLVRESWRASVTARYLSEVEDIEREVGNLGNVADEIWYVDTQGSYELGNITLTAGVRNLLDEEPPYVTNNSDMNTLNFSYDTAGRYFYTRIGMKF